MIASVGLRSSVAAMYVHVEAARPSEPEPAVQAQTHFRRLEDSDATSGVASVAEGVDSCGPTETPPPRFRHGSDVVQSDNAAVEEGGRGRDGLPP